MVDAMGSTFEDRERFRVAADTSTSLTDETNVHVNMSTEDYDPSNAYDLSADEFVAPRDGLYMIYLQTRVQASDGSQLSASVIISARLQDGNGNWVNVSRNDTSTTGRPRDNVTALAQLNEGDVIKPYCRYNDGGTGQSAQVAGDTSGTFMWGVRMGALP